MGKKTLMSKSDKQAIHKNAQFQLNLTHCSLQPSPCLLQTLEQGLSNLQLDGHGGSSNPLEIIPKPKCDQIHFLQIQYHNTIAVGTKMRLYRIRTRLIGLAGQNPALDSSRTPQSLQLS